MNKQVPLWTLILASTLAILFLCGISGAVASKPEPETKIVTEYKTKEIKVKDDSQTYEISELKTNLEQCQKALLLSSQGFVDVGLAFQQLAEAAGNFDADGITEAGNMIEAIDSGNIGSQAKECDPTIGSKITGLPE